MQKYAQSAFTLVELMITVIVIVILLGLGTVSISGLQAQGRDKEREQDIAAIARGLEGRYKRGNPVATPTSPNWNVTIGGTYPSISEFNHAKGLSSGIYTPNQIPGGYMTQILRGTTEESLQPPTTTGTFKVMSGGLATQARLESAFEKNGSNYADNYVYEPIGNISSGAAVICQNNTIEYPCLRFNLYWISETRTTNIPSMGIPGLQVVKSNHQ